MSTRIEIDPNPLPHSPTDWRAAAQNIFDPLSNRCDSGISVGCSKLVQGLTEGCKKTRVMSA